MRTGLGLLAMLLDSETIELHITSKTEKVLFVVAQVKKLTFEKLLI